MAQFLNRAAKGTVVPIIPIMPAITFEVEGLDTLEDKLAKQILAAARQYECTLERDPDEDGFLRLTLPEGNNVLKLNRATAAKIREVITNNLEKDAPAQEDQPPHGKDPP